MESDHVTVLITNHQSSRGEAARTMLPRVVDVEVTLAEAIAIHQDDADKEEEDEVQEEDRANWCRNPFCQKTLQNSYARHCEEKRTTCQQYRALRLQCVANAELAIIQEMNSLGRMDSFLVLGMSCGEETKQNVRSTRESEANAPFVIPRRKRPCNISATGATLNNESRSHESTPPRQFAVRFRRAVSVETPGSSSRKRPRVGTRRQGLVHFEPRAPRATTVPALAVSSQMRARRVQQASRWTQARQEARRSSVDPRSLRGTSQANVSAGGGGYAQSVNRSSLQHSMCGFPPSYKPQLTTCTQASPTPMTAKTNSRVERTAPRESPGLSYQRRVLRRTIPHSSRGEQLQEYRRSGHERTNEDFPQPHFTPLPACSNGYSDRRSYREMTNAALLSTNCERREDSWRTESYRNPSDGDERFRPRQALYDDEDNQVNYKAIHVTANAVDRRYSYPTDRQDDNRWSTSSYSNFRRSPSGVRTSGGSHDSKTDDNCVDVSADQPLRRQQNVPARVSVERPPEVVSRYPIVMTPVRFTPANEVAGTDETISSDTDADCEPMFSYHDPFLQVLLSKFIQKLPGLLEPVMNVTKNPRKLWWYIDYTKKIKRVCKPHVRIQLENTQIVVMVENRVWLKLKGPSTVARLHNVIKTMRDEAISWRNLKSEFEQSLDHYRNRLGNEVNLSNVFLRAWNNLKDRPGETSLSRGSNYYCGARRYHWTFILGKVEIGRRVFAWTGRWPK